MKTRLLKALLVLILAPTIVFAARPSITSLQQQINQLQAQVDQQPRHPVAVDSNGKRIGDVLGTYKSAERTNGSGTLQLFTVVAILSINTDQGSDVNVILTTVQASEGVGMNGSRLLFDQPNCEGNVIGIETASDPSGLNFTLMALAGLYTQFLGTENAEFIAYVPDQSVRHTNVAYNSRSGGGWQTGEFRCSFPGPGTISALPVKEVIDLSEEAATWVPPVRIEMAP